MKQTDSRVAVKKSNRAWIIPVVVLILVLVGVRILRVKMLQATPKISEVPTPVVVTPAYIGQVSTVIVQQGIVSSETESAVAPQVMARCVGMYKHEGDVVKAGEIIARLDDQELQSNHAAQISEMQGANETALSQSVEVDRAREDAQARMADVSSAESSVQAQLAEVSAAKEAVAAQEAEVERARANLNAAEVAASTQAARTSRDKTLFDNKAISQEQWESSQTTLAQAKAVASALTHQIVSLGKAVDAAKDKVVALQSVVESGRQHVQSLKNTAANSQQRITSQRRTVEAARRKVEAMANYARVGQTRLGYTVIRAPYDAVITSRLAEPGDLLVPGQPIYRVLKPGSVKIIVNVAQDNLKALRPGSVALLSTNAGQMRATVNRVYPALNGAHLGTVEIVLPRAPFGLKSGSSLEVSLETKSGKGLVVPTASVLQSSTGSYVYLVRNGTIHTEQVNIDVQGEAESTIRGHVQAGDQAIIAQPAELMSMHDGQQVVVTSGKGDSHAIR
ncbi:MAG: efflux RND transporter periplasmic adaptor subunit [Armatimonadota bacterium]